jgi:hypothetical protein
MARGVRKGIGDRLSVDPGRCWYEHWSSRFWEEDDATELRSPRAHQVPPGPRHEVDNTVEFYQYSYGDLSYSLSLCVSRSRPLVSIIARRSTRASIGT